MKYSKDDYNTIKNALKNIKWLDADMSVNKASESYKENGMTFTRFLWDMYHYAIDTIDPHKVFYLVDTYSDSHIETAMKNLAKDFGIEKW